MKTTPIDILAKSLREVETADGLGMLERAICAHRDGTRKIPIQAALMVKALDELRKSKREAER